MCAHHSSSIPQVCLYVFVCVRYIADEIAPPPPLFLNVISLPLGPPTNPPNREKMERFIGTAVRTPPGFMASRQRLSLSPEKAGIEEEGETGKGTEQPYLAFAYRGA